MAYPFTDKMTLVERIQNILYTMWTRLYYRYWHLPRAQSIANEWAPGVSVYDIDKNFSLVILGNNHVFGYPKPLLPHVIEIHSLQISEKLEPLPEVNILKNIPYYKKLSIISRKYEITTEKRFRESYNNKKVIKN